MEFFKPDTIPHQLTVILSANRSYWITSESFSQTVNVRINLGCSFPLNLLWWTQRCSPKSLQSCFPGTRKVLNRQVSTACPFRNCLGFSELPQPKSCYWECGPHPMVHCLGSIKTHSVQPNAGYPWQQAQPRCPRPLLLCPSLLLPPF